ncbi:MAG TPA: Ig-like domain repeat protein [Candidatus Limnocylindrales bacterium]|nr:Ig-like domain repeat protein [Candidatus Limnocylindrales bacterium]
MRRHAVPGAIAALVLALLLPVPAATAATAGCADQAGQLVENCGFETGDWSSWTPEYNTSAAAVMGASDGVTPYDGSYMLGAATVGTSPYGLLTQAFETTPGTWYTASVRWMGGHATATGIEFTAEVVDGWRGFVIASNYGGYTSDWAAKKISFKASSTTAVFNVRWVNPAGRYYFDELSVVPAATPGAPSITSLTAADYLPGEVIVGWKAPGDLVGMPPLLGFNVYARPADGSYGSTPANGSTPVWQSYGVTGLTDGQLYCFVVKAVSEVGEGTPSAEECKAPIGLPSAPVLTSLEPGPGSITLHWTAPAYAGQGLWKYEFSSALWDGSACGTYNDIPHTLASDPAATSATLTGWPAGQEYCFVIWALDTSGYPGPRSNVLHAAANPIPTSVTPGAPAQAVVGAQVTYTAGVSPSSASGTVAFLDGGTPIPGCGNQSVTWGTTYCEVTYTTPGTHDITANFTAGSGYLDSTSASAARTLVTYGVSVLTPGVRVAPGSTATFRIQLVDAAGANLSASGIAVTVTGVSPSLGTTVDGTMTFVPAAHKKPAFYTYKLPVPASATVGSYQLSFTATGDPVTHQDLAFTVATKRK